MAESNALPMSRRQAMRAKLAHCDNIGSVNAGDINCPSASGMARVNVLRKCDAKTWVGIYKVGGGSYYLALLK